jgi:GNAT superfamily N-acetyltransferase
MNSKTNAFRDLFLKNALQCYENYKEGLSTEFPSSYFGIDELCLNGARLKDKPKDEIARVVKEEFEKRNSLVSEEDVLQPNATLGHILQRGKHGFYYHSKRFSDSAIERENFDRGKGEFIVHTTTSFGLSPSGSITVGKTGVNPKYQGMGLGRTMYEIIESIAKRLDIKIIVLTEPVTSQRFWKRIGFTKHLHGDNSLTGLAAQYKWRKKLK